MLWTFYYLRLSRRYRVTAVESTAKYGNSLCIIEIAAGMGLSILNKPPAVTVAAKNKTVTTMALISTGPSGAT